MFGKLTFDFSEQVISNEFGCVYVMGATFKCIYRHNFQRWDYGHVLKEHLRLKSWKTIRDVRPQRNF